MATFIPIERGTMPPCIFCGKPVNSFERRSIVVPDFTKETAKGTLAQWIPQASSNLDAALDYALHTLTRDGQWHAAMWGEWVFIYPFCHSECIKNRLNMDQCHSGEWIPKDQIAICDKTGVKIAAPTARRYIDLYTGKPFWIAPGVKPYKVVVMDEDEGTWDTATISQTTAKRLVSEGWYECESCLNLFDPEATEPRRRRGMKLKDLLLQDEKASLRTNHHINVDSLDTNTNNRFCMLCVPTDNRDFGIALPTHEERAKWRHTNHALSQYERTIGIEIECEPTPISQIRMMAWHPERYSAINIGTDGSLRGPYPVEYTSPILHECNYTEWLEEFSKRIDAKVYNRCGLHIHVGTKDMSWAEINQIGAYCYRYEAFFFSMVSPSRHPTLHEGPAGCPRFLPQQYGFIFPNKASFLTMLYGRRVNFDYEQSIVRLRHSKRCNDTGVNYPGGLINRYYWLNLHGHFFKRAIEIRLHQGTVNKDKIANWIQLWLNLIPKISSPSNFEHNPYDLMPVHLRKYYVMRSRTLHGGDMGCRRKPMATHMHLSALVLKEIERMQMRKMGHKPPKREQNVLYETDFIPWAEMTETQRNLENEMARRRRDFVPIPQQWTYTARIDRNETTT